MWGVSQRFLDALGKPHEITTAVTVTPPGGTATPLQVKSGAVSADASSRARRKGSLELYGTAQDFDLITTDGARLTITHGISFGADSELVPVLTGEIVDGTQELGDGTISFNCVDDWQWVTRARFLTPYSPNPMATRQAAIAAIIVAAKPDVVVLQIASDTGLAGVQVWSESRSDAVNDLAAAGNMDAFFRPDGVFVIRDKPSLTTPPVWSALAGAGGVLSTASRTRPKGPMYNTVVVRGTAADGTQAWPQQVAQITDTSSPRHPSKIGVVPYFFSSPTITDAGSAYSVAVRMLDRFQGSTESLSLGIVSNPALDAQDTIRVITPQINEQPAQAFTHFIDTLDLDLLTGRMGLTTRSQADG